MADFSDYEPKRVDQFTEIDTVTDNDLLYMEKSSNSRGYKVKAKDVLPSGSVGTTKIANGAVTTDKLGASAVTTAKIADGAVTSDKLSSALQTTLSNLEDNVSDLTEELPEKANIDGYYDEMAVGSAEQLLSNTYESDTEPYLYRTSGGSLEIGDRVYEDAIVGGSVAWNQLAPTTNADWSKSNVTLSGNSSEWTITSDSDETTLKALYINFPINHVAFCSAYLKSNDEGVSAIIGLHKAAGLMAASAQTDSSSYTLCQVLGKMPSDAMTPSFVIRMSNGAAEDTSINAKEVICVDLTLMFGSAIADYVNTLESGTAGAGVAWLKANGFFNKFPFTYNAGGIESTKTSAKKVVGFNQFDGENWFAEKGFTKQSDGSWYIANNSSVSGYLWENKANYAGQMCVSYKVKYASSTGSAGLRAKIYYTDGTFESDYPSVTTSFTQRTKLSASGKVVSSIAFDYGSANNGTYLKDFNINFSWDGERDGEYEPYVEHTYSLDSDLELRGIPTLVDGKIKYVGDLYASDGTVTRRYGIVDLGTLTWNYDGTLQYFYANVTGKKAGFGNIRCSKYVTNNVAGVANLGDKQIVGESSGTAILVKDSAYTDKNTFKTAMNGVYLVYSLATPTTETADPYTNPQIVDNWGTEEFVDTRDVPVPVGHDSRYLPDLKAKIESAPNNPSVNGNYVLNYANGEATYVPVPTYFIQDSIEIEVQANSTATITVTCPQSIIGIEPVPMITVTGVGHYGTVNSIGLSGDNVEIVFNVTNTNNTDDTIGVFTAIIHQ